VLGSTFQRVYILAQEVDVLKHAASLPEDMRSRPASNQGASTEVMASLRQAAAALSMNPAEQIRATVFRPTHILPTVTLAEQVRCPDHNEAFPTNTLSIKLGHVAHWYELSPNLCDQKDFLTINLRGIVIWLQPVLTASLHHSKVLYFRDTAARRATIAQED